MTMTPEQAKAIAGTVLGLEEKIAKLKQKYENELHRANRANERIMAATESMAVWMHAFKGHSLDAIPRQVVIEMLGRFHDELTGKAKP